MKMNIMDFLFLGGGNFLEVLSKELFKVCMYFNLLSKLNTPIIMLLFESNVCSTLQ